MQLTLLLGEICLLLTARYLQVYSAPQYNPHVPMQLTWMVTNPETGHTLRLANSTRPMGTWFPDLSFDLCKLAKGSWYSQQTDISPGNPYPDCRSRQWYICPGGERTYRCGGPGDYFCASWGCETSWSDPGWPGHGHRGNGPVIFQRTRFGWSNITIRFTDEGKKLTTEWVIGKTWGLRLYFPFSTDIGIIFSVRLQADPIFNKALRSNKVSPQPPSRTPTKQVKPVLEATVQAPSTALSIPVLNFSAAGQRPDPVVIAPRGITHPDPTSPMLQVLQQSFLFLNATRPETTRACWLCYDASPPFYEGIVVAGTYSVGKVEDCRWHSKVSLSLQQVMGTNGTCVGNVTAALISGLCSEVNQVTNSTDDYLVPHNDTWWACDTGLTPCVHSQVLERHQGFCVIIRLLPRLLYHSDEEFLNHFDHDVGPVRQKRELISLTLSILLGAGIAAGIGTGTAALVTQQQTYSSLRADIDLDLRRIEDSISDLEDSLSSLAEVALQNRRGLDLLFLQQGGLCVALKEECCFFRDHSGKIKDNMAALKEGLEQRKREREQAEPWYKNLFSTSPWLSALLPNVLGPFIGFLIVISFGPWAFKKLTGFIKNQIDDLTAKPIQIHYLRLALKDREEPYEPERPHDDVFQSSP